MFHTYTDGTLIRTYTYTYTYTYSLKANLILVNISFKLVYSYLLSIITILKICPPAMITSAEVIIAEYDAIIAGYDANHLSNDTNIKCTSMLM